MSVYLITMRTKCAGDVTLTFYGRDRDDIIEFVKKHYRRVLKKIVSARKCR
jgi:hypothetical protein